MKHILISAILAILPVGMVTAQTADKTVVVVSDLHMSDARSFNADKYYPFTDRNMSLIQAFMQKLASEPDQWDELVLNGDIFEFWRAPYDVQMVADENGNVITRAEYLRKIEEQNQAVFDVIRQLKNAGKTIVYLPGNHDVCVTDNDVRKAFGDLFTTSYDCAGNGLYEPFGSNTAVAIEHGNRYEYFNAAYIPSEYGVPVDNDWIIAPGYFTSHLGASATVYKAQQGSSAKTLSLDDTQTTAGNVETDGNNRSLIAAMWNAIRAGAGSPSYDITVDFGGTFGQTARWSDYAVSETNNPTLFPDSWTVSNWEKRCKDNNVPVHVPFGQSLLSAEFHDPYYDELAFTERLQNDELPTLICVWGHSHKKKLQSRHDDVKGDVIYLNEGAWVDDVAACTYGVVSYKAAKHQYTVEVRQLDADGNDAVLDCKYLYVPENNASKLADGSWQFNAKAMLIDADIDGISQIENGELKKENSAIYNLNGQQLSAPVKGINIVDGRKVVVR